MTMSSLERLAKELALLNLGGGISSSAVTWTGRHNPEPGFDPHTSGSGPGLARARARTFQAELTAGSGLPDSQARYREFAPLGGLHLPALRFGPGLKTDHREPATSGAGRSVEHRAARPRRKACIDGRWAPAVPATYRLPLAVPPAGPAVVPSSPSSQLPPPPPPHTSSQQRSRLVQTFVAATDDDGVPHSLQATTNCACPVIDCYI